MRDSARGRGLRVPGPVVCLGLTWWLVACSDGGPGPPGPVADRIEDYDPPTRERTEGTERILNHGPRERLRVYPELPDGPVRLLFLDGASATRLDDGRAAWPDRRNARIVFVDDRGVVDGILQGAPPDGRRLADPVHVAEWDGGVLAVEPTGEGLLFEDGQPRRWLDLDLGGAVSGGAGRLVATRTVFDIPLRPLPESAPLLWSWRDGQAREVGRAAGSGEPLLAGLANSGWAGKNRRGEVVFASAVRPEIRGYDDRGALEWVAEWASPVETPEPRFKLEGGGLAPRFTFIQRALVVDEKNRIWILVSGEEVGEPEDRVLVFDDSGVWIREGRVPPGSAVYTDRAGRLYATPPAKALSRTEASTRAAFRSFDLPVLNPTLPEEARDSVSLDDLRGKVAVVNFWASWCTPCRQEMPLLDRWYREQDTGRVALVGIDEDMAPRDGWAFLEELGGVSYPVLEGGGRLQAVYHYRGLPYTVVLDTQGRIVQTVYGFGSSIAPITDAVAEELVGTGEGR